MSMGIGDIDSVGDLGIGVGDLGGIGDLGVGTGVPGNEMLYSSGLHISHTHCISSIPLTA
jgi:hypothetical protein